MNTKWMAECKEVFNSDQSSNLHDYDIISRAVAIWKCYPTVCETIECSQDSTRDDKDKARRELRELHHAATRFLAIKAELIGINSAPIWESQRICNEIFGPIRFTSYSHFPKSYGVCCFSHYECSSDLWPDCLGEWRYSLPIAMQEAIRQGEEAIMRLVTTLEAKQIAPGPSTGLRLATKSESSKKPFLTIDEIANELGITKKAASGRFDRLRLKFSDCYIENESRRPREPKYLLKAEYLSRLRVD